MFCRWDPERAWGDWEQGEEEFKNNRLKRGLRGLRRWREGGEGKEQWIKCYMERKWRRRTRYGENVKEMWRREGSEAWEKDEGKRGKIKRQMEMQTCQPCIGTLHFNVLTKLGASDWCNRKAFALSSGVQILTMPTTSIVRNEGSITPCSLDGRDDILFLSCQSHRH